MTREPLFGGPQFGKKASDGGDKGERGVRDLAKKIVSFFDDSNIVEEIFSFLTLRDGREWQGAIFGQNLFSIF